MGLKSDPFCSGSFKHRQVPFGAGFVEAKNIQTILAPDLDVAVVRPVPLVKRFKNLDLMPAETESSGHRHSAIVSMLLDVNTHFWFQGHSNFAR